MTGQIRKIVAAKGFGFIREDGGDTEYFFHRSGMAGGASFEQLREGQSVVFEKEDSQKGPRATCVQGR